MRGENNQSSNDYFTLKPESATLLDLLLFTISFSFVDIRKLVDCPPGKEELYKSFGDRWIIVNSIFLQKIFLSISNKLKFLKRMRAKIWGEPLKTHAPKVKCRDWRVEVRKNMKLGGNDLSYYGALTIMASTLAYEDPYVVQTVVNNCWNMELGKCYDFWNDFQNKATTQAFTFKTTATNPNITIVAFRGTSELDDVLVDLNLSWYNIKGIGHIHSGFMQALGLQKATGWPKDLPLRPDNREFSYYSLRQALREAVQANENAHFMITGHSLGGALAVLFVTILAFHGEVDLLRRVLAVFTFGQPRVGNQEFAQFMDGITKSYGTQFYRYVYSFDLVPRVPFDFRNKWYKHCGAGCLYYNCCYKGEYLEDQPNKNYFFEILLIPRKYLTALWELIRSIVIPIFKGPSYFEGFSTLIFRLFGLILPGASAHMCQNYIYLTRYGKLKLPEDIVVIEP